MMLYAPVYKFPQLVNCGRRWSKDQAATIGVNNAHDTIRLEYSAHFLQRGQRLAQVEEHRLGISGVERRIRKGEFVNAAHFEANVFDVAFAGQGARGLYLSRLDVDSDYVAGSNSLREAKCDTAGSAAAIEQSHSWVQVMQEKAATLVRPTTGKIPVKGWYANMDVALSPFGPLLDLRCRALTHGSCPPLFY
jgi:hypothetical protein